MTLRLTLSSLHHMVPTMPRKLGRPAKPANELKVANGGGRRVTITLPEDILVAIDARAERNRRTRTAEVECILDLVINGGRL